MKRALVVVAALAAALVVGLAAGGFWSARERSERGRPGRAGLRARQLSTPPCTRSATRSKRPSTWSWTRVRSISRACDRQPNFGPYEQSGPPRVTRAEHGDLGRARYVYRLVCLKEGCDPAEARGVSDFPSGRASLHASKTGAATRSRRSTGRCSRSRAVSRTPTSSRSAGAPTRARCRLSRYRVAPLAAGLRAARSRIRGRRCGGAARVAPVVAREQRGRRDRWTRISPGARSNGPSTPRCEEPDDGDSPRRRRALERVARELGALGRPELVDEARALAWSPTASTSGQIERLAGLVGRLGYGDGNAMSVSDWKLRPPPCRHPRGCGARRPRTGGRGCCGSRSHLLRSRSSGPASCSPVRWARCPRRTSRRAAAASSSWTSRRAWTRRRRSVPSECSSALAETEGRVGLVRLLGQRLRDAAARHAQRRATPLLPFFRAGPQPSRDSYRRGRGGRTGPSGPQLGQPRESPWSFTFRGGTRISTGLTEARHVIEREGDRSLSVLLVSDLDDSGFDTSALTEELRQYEQSGIDLRVIPLFPLRRGPGAVRATGR